MSSVRIVDSPATGTRELIPLLRVWVAGNPASGNHMYLNRKRATGAQKRSKVLTPAASSWLEAVATETMPWRFPESAPRPTLAVSCTFIGARADVDNLLKLTLDGLKIGLAVDDRYVQRVCAEKLPLVRSKRNQSNSAQCERGAWIEVSQLPALQKPQRQPRQRRQPQQKRTA